MKISFTDLATSFLKRKWTAILYLFSESEEVINMPAFPYFKKLDSMDCGPCCLRMIARYYGKSYTIQYLRSKSFITKSGVSMAGISDAAESIGFRTRSFRLTWAAPLSIN